MSNYFGNSPATLVSHIVKEENLSKEEILQLKELFEKMEYNHIHQHPSHLKLQSPRESEDQQEL